VQLQVVQNVGTGGLFTAMCMFTPDSTRPANEGGLEEALSLLLFHSPNDERIKWESSVERDP